MFLDIQMPGMSGFDVLARMPHESMPMIVFVTAFDRFALDAFEAQALDYLLKPIRIEKLKEAVIRAEQRLQEKKVNTRIGALISNFQNISPALQKIGLPDEGGLVFEEINNLVHLQASGSYTFVFTKDQKKRIVTKSLKELEDILPDTIFCRLHNSHIVNLNYIKKYFKGRGGYVELEDGTIIEVSIRKKDEFLEKFKI